MKHPLIGHDLWYTQGADDYALVTSRASTGRMTEIRRFRLCASADRHNRLSGQSWSSEPDVLATIALPISRRDTLALVRTLAIPDKTHRQLVKDIRRRSMEAQRKYWWEVLPPEIVRWAEEVLAMEEKRVGDPYVDNYRVARSGNTAQVRRFRRQCARGCCGSHEWSDVGPDGRRYFFGFNYGH